MPQLIKPTVKVVSRTEPTIGNLPVSQVTSAGVNPDYNSSVYNTARSENATGIFAPKPTVPAKGTFETVLSGVEKGLGIATQAYGLFNQIKQKTTETFSTNNPTTISVAQASPGTKGTSAPATDSSNTIIIGTDKGTQATQSGGQGVDFSFLAIAGIALFAVVLLRGK